MWSIYVRFSNCVVCLRKISSIGWSKMERFPKWGKHLQVATTVNDGLYLLMTRIVRSWSTSLTATCMTNCFCLIFCNPFAMFGWEPICVVFDWSVAWGVTDLKKDAIFLCYELVWLCCCPSTSPYVSWVLARKAPNIVGPYFPLPCLMCQKYWACACASNVQCVCDHISSGCMGGQYNPLTHTIFARTSQHLQSVMSIGWASSALEYWVKGYWAKSSTKIEVPPT